jgi:hypothetical protein
LALGGFGFSDKGYKLLSKRVEESMTQIKEDSAKVNSLSLVFIFIYIQYKVSDKGYKLLSKRVEESMSQIKEDSAMVNSLL